MRVVSALETKIRQPAFKPCFQVQLAPLHHGMVVAPEHPLAERAFFVAGVLLAAFV
jgi:hypothetical protein